MNAIKKYVILSAVLSPALNYSIVAILIPLCIEFGSAANRKKITFVNGLNVIMIYHTNVINPNIVAILMLPNTDGGSAANKGPPISPSSVLNKSFPASPSKKKRENPQKSGKRLDRGAQNRYT